MVNMNGSKLFILLLMITCAMKIEFTSSNPFKSASLVINNVEDTKLLVNNKWNRFVRNLDDKKIDLVKAISKADDDDDDDDDKEKDKDKNVNKEDKKDEKIEDVKDEKIEDVKDDKKEDTKDDAKDDDGDDEKKNNNKEDKKSDKDAKKVDEKIDKNQKEDKTESTNFDDSSQEDDSHSNPETEEEGNSESESDEDDKNEEKEPVKGKLEKKLLIILVSGFRYDYLHIKKLNAINEILKNGVTAKVKPSFPSNSYPNHYSLMTGLNPVKNGFIDDEMYDIKYKEAFPGKGHNHKHWWNKVTPLWISAMNNKIKVGTYWWKGACKITIKGRTPRNCIEYKEKVSLGEVSKQLKNIVELFGENKLDLAMVSFEEIDRAGHLFGPESYKLRKVVRNFDKMLGELMKEIDDNNIKNKVNVLVVSDHGMISIGEKIDLEKFIDFNDIDKFVNTGTFAMLLPEDNKEDYVFNSLRNAHIEGLNVYKKPDFPPKFKFEKIDTELILPIVLTTDKGYYIGEPSVDKDGNDDDNDSDDITKKGIHGYHPLHVKEMNAAIFGIGPDLEKNHVVNTIDQVDLYNVFCKLLEIKPNTNDGNKDIVNDFLHSSSSEEHNEEDNQVISDEDSGEVEEGYAPEKKKNQNLPVFKSRWALRGNSICVSSSSFLQFIAIIMSLFIFILRF